MGEDATWNICPLLTLTVSVSSLRGAVHLNRTKPQKNSDNYQIGAYSNKRNRDGRLALALEFKTLASLQEVSLMRCLKSHSCCLNVGLMIHCPLANTVNRIKKCS